MLRSHARPTRVSALAAAALALAAGCAAESSPAGQGVSVEVSPRTADLYPAESLGFSAVVTGAASTAVVWSVLEGASGGTVDASGLYTAPGDVGTYHVVATSVAAPAVTGAATVTVTLAPQIAVTISPRNPSIRTNQTVTFQATVSGTTPGQSTAVGWSVEEAGGGTIDASGRYTPPATPGTYHVAAASEADPTKTDRTAVTVTLPPDPGAVPAAMPRVASTRFEPAVSRTSAAMPVSGLGRAVVWWDRSQDLGGWDTRLAIAGNTCRSCPVDYVIEGSSNGGASWTPLLTVIGNPYYTRAHVVDLTGQTSVRLRLTASANDGRYYFLEINVHDARDGVDDWWVFFGDSLVDNVFRGITGQAPLGTGRFGENVNARAGTRFPVAHNGAVSAGTMNHYLEVVNGRTRFEQWMADFPGKYVSIGIGTNDINGYSDHAITAAELDVMQGKYERLVQYAIAAGKTVVIPTLRWTNTNAYTGVNIASWNARLWNDVLPKYPGAIRGADTYTRSLAQGSTGLVGDRTHLNNAGATLTQEDWASWVLADVYAP